MSTESKWGKPSRKRTVADWAEEHRVYQWLMPLKTRKTNPLKLIERLSKGLDALPKTQATFTHAEIPGTTQFRSGYYWGVKQLFLLRKHECTSRKNRFHNPQYMHYGHGIDKINDPQERLEFYHNFKESPTITGEWIGTHWGIKRDGVSWWLRQRGINLGEQIRANQRKMGRTLWTIAQWDYDLMPICERVPVTTKTAKDWAYRHGKNAADWEPPERPTDEPWYAGELVDQ